MPAAENLWAVQVQTDDITPVVTDAQQVRICVHPPARQVALPPPA
jgi:hypothetical protein